MHTEPFIVQHKVKINVVYTSGLVVLFYLLPTGSKERDVFGVESIPVAILPSCQYIKMLNHNCIDINIIG